jgi:hypothetical protein
MVFLYFTLIFLVLLFFFVIYLQSKFTYFLKNPWKAKKFYCETEKIKNFEKKHSYFSSHPLIGKVSNLKEDIDITNDLFLSIHENIKNPQKRLLAAAEVISKVLAYRDLKRDFKIFIPTIDINGKPTLTTYFVDNVFNIWKQMPAFGLIPENRENAPILLFRGTDLSLTTKRGRSSLLSDLDIAGPGFHAFLNARKSINYWLKKAYKKVGVKARVLGFSLGGVLTSYTVLFEYRLITFDRYQPSMSFNPPGVTKKVYQRWENLKDEKKPPFFVFITKNDLITKFGRLFGEIYKLVPRKRIPSFYAHVALIIAEDEYHLYPVDRW